MNILSTLFSKATSLYKSFCTVPCLSLYVCLQQISLHHHMTLYHIARLHLTSLIDFWFTWVILYSPNKSILFRVIFSVNFAHINNIYLFWQISNNSIMSQFIDNLCVSPLPLSPLPPPFLEMSTSKYDKYVNVNPCCSFNNCRP